MPTKVTYNPAAIDIIPTKWAYTAIAPGFFSGGGSSAGNPLQCCSPKAEVLRDQGQR
jgi:hypothetical protein